MKTLLQMLGIRKSEPRGKRSSRSHCHLGMESLEKREVMAAIADLVAYRPVTANIDYTRYPVPDYLETDVAKGPGIRINGDDDNRNGIADRLDKKASAIVDDDLVRVDVRSNTLLDSINWSGNLAVWSTPTKQTPFIPRQLVFTGQTLWVEYLGTGHTVGANTWLSLTPIGNDGKAVTSATDKVVFHSFKSDVVTFGGAWQDPLLQKGTFAIALHLYQQGYDVHTFRDSAVDPSGRGPAYDQAVSAIIHRGVTNLAVIGMSYGGGATHDLSAALASNAMISGRYQLAYSAYIDAVKHYSFPPLSETRMPVGSKYHDNIFQTSDVSTWAPHGNYVNGAQNINVTSLGSKLNHGTIDGDLFVQWTIRTNLQTRMTAR